MYKIGDFSKISEVSIKTLRYYDDINLLKPSYQDFFTGYRYYEETQLNEITLIKNLKELGLTLTEIKKYIESKEMDIFEIKKKGFEKTMKKIDEFIEKNKKQIVYSIRESDYNEYVIINGIKQSLCPQALEVRDNNAKYYIIEKNNTFFDDFCVFAEDNWITIEKDVFLDDNLLNQIINGIKKDFDFLATYVLEDKKDVIDKIKEKFEIISDEEIEEGSFKFKKIKFHI